MYFFFFFIRQKTTVSVNQVTTELSTLIIQTSMAARVCIAINDLNNLQRFHPMMAIIYNYHVTVNIADIFSAPEESFNIHHLIKVYTVPRLKNRRRLRRATFQCHSWSPIDSGLPILIWRLLKLPGRMLLWKLRGRRLYELWNHYAVQFLQYRLRVMLCQENIQAAQEIRASSFWILCGES